MLSFFFFATSYILISNATPQATIFNININKPGPTIIDEFLSMTIDASLVEHWTSFPFNSTLVNTLASGLSPAYLRYGGTHGDETAYATNGNITKLSSYNSSILTLNEFSTLADFVERNHWKFIFGLNAQDRFPINNTWNPSNAQDLINKIIESDRDNLVIGYELGNEPDGYPQHNGMVNVSAKQMASDFVTLYNLINNLYKNSDYKPFIWGCDTCCGLDYFKQFLSNTSDKTINGATWHQYYGNGATWTLADFVKISNLDKIIGEINESLSIVHQELSPNSYDILGETSSTYGGGTANLSSGFVAGFLWLDKLGLSSGLGLHVVARQDFWGGNYGLIGNGKDFNPNPDYWSSYLFKNLVGNTVLYVDGEFDNGRSIRTYAFCTRTKNKGSVFDYNNGDVTVMILNVQNNTVNVGLNVQGDKYDQYLLTSYPEIIQSRDVLLNGKVLEMVNDKTFPTMKANTVNGGSIINMEALSYGFVVILNANASACS